MYDHRCDAPYVSLPLMPRGAERGDLFKKKNPDGPYTAGTPGKNASTLTRTPPAKIREYVRLRAEGLNKTAAAREVGISKPTAYAIENLMSQKRQDENARRNRVVGTSTGLPASSSTSKKTMAGGRAGHGNPWANGYATLLGDEDLPGPIPYDELSDVARDALEDFALFRRRYFGRGPSPWQVDAATRVCELLQHAQETRDREYVVLNAPPGAGKSTLWHDVIVWLICRDRSVRVLVGSRTTTQAIKYTRRIRRALMQRDLIFPDERDLAVGLAVAPEGVLVEDFGRFKPQGRSDGDVWQMGGFTVSQPGDVLTSEKEPTVTAFGFDADYMGMRVDLAVWDDLVDPANVRNLEVIEKLQEDWDGVAEARIDPGGVNVLQGQRIRHNDLYRYCLDKRRAVDDDEDEGTEPQEFVPKYRHILYPAHFEDRCRSAHKRTDVAADPSRPGGDDNPGCLLDPRRIPWRDIKTLQSEQPDVYRVVWQQEDLDPGEALIQKIWVDGGKDPVTGTLFIGCWDHDRPMWKLPAPAAIPAPNHLALVVDPSPSNWWACHLWLLNQPSERRYLLAIDRRRMTAPEFLDWDSDKGVFTGFLEEWWQRSNDMGMAFRYVVLEVNAAQKWLLQYDHARRWAQKRSVNFVPHTTGVLKTDKERGIPAVKGHWRSGRIRLPGAPDGSMQAATRLVHEMLRWPHGMTDDQVMAHWFFEFTAPKLAPSKVATPPSSRRPSWMRSWRGALAG